MTREHISRILEPREILLSFKTGFNIVKAAVVCAILESISALKPSSVITEPRYLKLVTVSSFCPFTLISVLMPLVPRELYRVFDYRQSRSRRRSDARARLCPTGSSLCILVSVSQGRVGLRLGSGYTETGKHTETSRGSASHQSIACLYLCALRVSGWKWGQKLSQACNV